MMETSGAQSLRVLVDPRFNQVAVDRFNVCVLQSCATEGAHDRPRHSTQVTFLLLRNSIRNSPDKSHNDTRITRS